MFDKDMLNGMICLKDMELEQIQELVRNNLKFRDKIYELAYEDISELIQYEYLRDFEGDYEFGGVYCTRVSLSRPYHYGAVEWANVCEWVERVEKCYSWLWRDMQKDALELAEQARELDEKLSYYDLSDANITRIENKIDSIKQELESRIIDAIDLELDSLDDTEYLADVVENYNYAFDSWYMDKSGNIYRATLEKIA